MGRTKRKRLRNKLRNICDCLDHEVDVINLRKFMARNDFREEISLKLCNFPQTGRGLATTKTIHPNEVIIRVPYNLMITYTTLLQSLNFPLLFMPKSKLTIHDLLVVFLVIEKHKKQSFWSSYVNALPSKAPWIPALLNSEYIELLPADLRLAAEKSRNLLKESWSRLRKSIKRDWTCSCCGKKADCVLDLNTFTWGYILVNTRAVYVSPEIVRKMVDVDDQNILSDEPCMALCPYLDMFNHSHEARTEVNVVLFEGQLVYQLTTLTPIKKYEQVFISYGAHSNVKLLMEYGFFIPEKSIDFVPVSEEVIYTVLKPKLNSDQYRFIRRHELNKLSDLYINENGPSFSLKAFLFVALKDKCKNFSSVVYSECYPEDFEKELKCICHKVLCYQMNFVDNLLNFGFITSANAPALVDFLKYRRELIKILYNNKQ